MHKLWPKHSPSFGRYLFGAICFAWRGLALACALGLPLADLHADSPRYDLPEYDGPGLIGLSIGYFDFAKQDNQAADFRVEYRSDLGIRGFRPWIALEVTSDAAVYGAGGILIDIEFDDRWILTPSVGAGAYSRGNGKDLGSVLQFRVQGDIAYRFAVGSRLALSVSHLSNARTANRNPGSEIISFYYQIPIGPLF